MHLDLGDLLAVCGCQKGNRQFYTAESAFTVSVASESGGYHCIVFI